MHVDVTQEADVLSSRIAIMTSGRTRIVDTPQALKQRFGKGMHLGVSLH